MRQVWRIFNLVAAVILACGAGGLAGLAAALGDWNWWSASSASSTALPDGAALPADLGQNLTFEEGQIDTVHYGVVGLAIAQAGNGPSAAAFATPGNQPWYVPRLIVGMLPPDDVAAFNLTTSKLASATLLEWPEQSPSSHAKIQGMRPTALHRLSYGRGRVLNDAQIASIKGRLQLTPEQERMWPAVEAALRNISYAKEAVAQNRSARDGDQIAYIDLDSAEVQRLKSVALPLIMHLSEDQKREVKSLAHVMGLDGVAASF
jgi:hypothetical protein